MHSGAIFDLDGTLVANMPVHAEAFSRFTERHGLPPLTSADRARLDGKRNRDIFPLLFGRVLREEEQMLFAEEKEGLYRELSRGALAPVAGLARLLAALQGHGVPVALATSAPAENVRHTLAELGLTERFAHVARSDEVGRGKPHPDVFLAAARLIGVPPGECVAFEDAPMGVMAARAAGMTCVAVATSFAAAALAEHGAEPHFTVSDFDEYLAGPGAWLSD